MNKLELTTEVLLNDLERAGSPEDKKAIAARHLKSMAQGAVNTLLNRLDDVEGKAILIDNRNLLAEYDLTFTKKSKKFQ